MARSGRAEEARVAYIALGSNLGDRLAYLRAAAWAFGEEEGVVLEGASRVYESEAHTLEAEEEAPPFLNAVIAVATVLSPQKLLERCLSVEKQVGERGERHKKWAPRTLDCDLLLVGNEICQTEALVLPHPRLSERRFVLEPLADLAPNLYIPPPHDATVRELLARCADPFEPQPLPATLLSSSRTASS